MLPALSTWRAALAGGLLGMAFAFGWSPCVGPVLAAILAVAGASATLPNGLRLLTIYSDTDCRWRSSSWDWQPAGGPLPFGNAALPDTRTSGPQPQHRPDRDRRAHPDRPSDGRGAVPDIILPESYKLTQDPNESPNPQITNYQIPTSHQITRSPNSAFIFIPLLPHDPARPTLFATSLWSRASARRSLRLAFLAVVVVAVLAAARYMQTRQQAIDELHDAMTSFGQEVHGLVVSTLRLRAAQRASWLPDRVTPTGRPRSAARSGPREWIRRVRQQAQSPEGQAALDTAAEQVPKLREIDKRALDYMKSNQRLMASDLIFTTASKPLVRSSTRPRPRGQRSSRRRSGRLQSLQQGGIIAGPRPCSSAC